MAIDAPSPKFDRHAHHLCICSSETKKEKRCLIEVTEQTTWSICAAVAWQAFEIDNVIPKKKWSWLATMHTRHPSFLRPEHATTIEAVWK